MKHYLIITLLGFIPFISIAQLQDAPKGFGFYINSSLSGELDPIRLVPSLTYIKGRNQLELGVGFNLSDRKFQKLISSELNYKYFPNGTENKLNMYLLAHFSYINNTRDTYYPTNYNYLFLNGGYGIEIKAYKRAYFGTNISTGVFTYSKKSDIPYEAFTSQKFFNSFRFNIAFQFNVGYRF